MKGISKNSAYPSLACIYLASFAIGIGLVTLMQKKYFQTLVSQPTTIENSVASED
jgi:hypothetical protein